MKKGSGTRSGLLWEVERILKECKELNCLPNYLTMENVPQVHGKKNIEDFNAWIECLNELGYKSVWKDLNTKNFKIPQNRNRCFMVSILDKERKFKMPEDLGLTLRLKDILEKEVDEKYYLSDKALNGVINTNFNSKKLEARTEKEGVLPTICARDYKDPKLCKEEITPERIGGLFDNEKGRHQAGSIWEKEKLSPTLDTAQGGYRTPLIEEDILKRKVANECIERELVEPTDVIDVSYSESRLKELQEGYIKKKNTENNNISSTLTTASNNFGVCVEEITEPLGCASRGRNPENPSSRKAGEYLEQRIEINKNGTSNCLTTVSKDNYVIEPNVLSQKRNEYGKQIRKQYESGEIEEKRKNMVDLMPREDGITNTITTFIKDNYLAEPTPSNK